MIKIETGVPVPRGKVERWKQAQARRPAPPPVPEPEPYPGPDGNVYQYAVSLLRYMKVGESCLTEVPDKAAAQRLAVSFAVAGPRLKQGVCTERVKNPLTGVVGLRVWRFA